MTDIGTLKELNVKPGDVVRWTGKNWTVHLNSQFADNEIHAISENLEWISGDADNCTIVFAKPKLWKDMTPEEKGALLLAHYEGRVVEISNPERGDDWVKGSEYGFHWNPLLSYRIRPEPKIETVTLYGNDIRFSGFLKGHRITFNLINGKPDCNSVKMEPLA